MLAHTFMARWLGPEMMITEAEALELSRAWVGWRSHYPMMMDPKTQALIHLGMVAGAIEGPRLMRASARKSAEKAAKRQADEATKGPNAPFQGQNIYPMGPAPRGA
jgi:hypothetical protein